MVVTPSPPSNEPQCPQIWSLFNQEEQANKSFIQLLHVSAASNCFVSSPPEISGLTGLVPSWNSSSPVPRSLVNISSELLASLLGALSQRRHEWRVHATYQRRVMRLTWQLVPGLHHPSSSLLLSSNKRSSFGPPGK